MGQQTALKKKLELCLDCFRCCMAKLYLSFPWVLQAHFHLLQYGLKWWRPLELIQFGDFLHVSTGSSLTLSWHNQFYEDFSFKEWDLLRSQVSLRLFSPYCYLFFFFLIQLQILKVTGQMTTSLAMYVTLVCEYVEKKMLLCRSLLEFLKS